MLCFLEGGVLGSYLEFFCLKLCLLSFIYIFVLPFIYLHLMNSWILISLIFLLAMPLGMWDLSSPARNRIHTPYIGSTMS